MAANTPVWAPAEESKRINVAIIGAGQLGAFLANELLCNHQSTYRPIFFVDKDAQKIGNNVVGLKVYAEDEQIFDQFNMRCPKCGKIYEDQIRRVCTYCTDHGALLKRLPVPAAAHKEASLF